MKILKPAEAFDKSAEIYQDKFMDVSLYAAGLNLFCEHILKDQASILDIACGPGNLIRYMLGRKPEYKVLGLDLSPRMLELAKLNNPSAHFQLLDCREISSLDQKFDGISCGFCLPYLSLAESVTLITDATGLLHPQGMFYLSTMIESEESKSRWQTSSTGDQVWVNYHREEDLVGAFSAHGFELLKTEHFTETDRDGVLITDLVVIGKKR